jgi:hypothetical protein
VEAGCVDASQHRSISRVLRRFSGLEELLRCFSSWPAVVARWRSAAEWFAGGAASLGRPWWCGREAARRVVFGFSVVTIALSGGAAPSLPLLRPQRRWFDGLGDGVFSFDLGASQEFLLRRLAAAALSPRPEPMV